MVGYVIKPFVAKADLLPYIDAIVRVYNRFGSRDNKDKARLKILVHEAGTTKFGPRSRANLPASTRRDCRRCGRSRADRGVLRKPCLSEQVPDEAPVQQKLREDAEFARFVEINSFAHTRGGYSIVTISLKPTGGTSGDASAAKMLALADAAERFSFGELRVSHEQNIVRPHVRRADLCALWQLLVPVGLARANSGMISDIIAVPASTIARWPPLDRFQLRKRFRNGSA
jgi:sulfite reductase (NADPH) hemoprotein beta-component